jgi:hypothetical protein
VPPLAAAPVPAPGAGKLLEPAALGVVPLPVVPANPPIASVPELPVLAPGWVEVFGVDAQAASHSALMSHVGFV